jgi:hypothetical protein
VSSSFTKQEMTAFDKMVEGFDDALVIAKGATKYQPEDPLEAARSRDVFWLPAPMIGQSYSGSDATGHFGDVNQLNVPCSVGNWKHSSKAFSALELRNSFAIDQWQKSAKQKLASDVNLSIFNMVGQQGSVFSKRTSAASGFDDVSQLDSAFARVGVQNGDRMAFYSPTAMNLMAKDLANRSEATSRSSNAYERAVISHDIAGFEVYKNDQEVLLAAASGGTTTVNGANQRTVPAATTTDPTYGENNKDNRYTDLTITAVTYANIKVGDAFTIGSGGTAVNALHMITKQDTGQLKTFRVVGKPSANVIRIYPAIIDAAEGSDASKEYANVSQTPANGAAITWLNTVNAPMNPFFKKESVLLIPGSFEVEDGSGVQSVSATTDLGVQIVYTKQTNINTLLSSCRYDIRWGTALLNPELAGCQMFNQT